MLWWKDRKTGGGETGWKESLHAPLARPQGSDRQGLGNEAGGARARGSYRGLEMRLSEKSKRLRVGYTGNKG